jgi:hypothetical protein
MQQCGTHYRRFFFCLFVDNVHISQVCFVLAPGMNCSFDVVVEQWTGFVYRTEDIRYG